MIDKNRSELERVHDDSFALIHMTGMRQSQKVYIDSILDGTLISVYPGILQMHGFYVDTDRMLVSFDLIIDFNSERKNDIIKVLYCETFGDRAGGK